jgi:hypothetical protein
MPVVHEGFLLKRSSGKIPRWQRRFFVLAIDDKKALRLLQYKKKNAQRTSRAIDLSSIRGIQSCNSDQDGQLDLELMLNDHTTVQLRAGQAIATEWLALLQSGSKSSPRRGQNQKENAPRNQNKEPEFIDPGWKPGDKVLYAKTGGSPEKVKIVKVHREDVEPYYTIFVPSTGRERQTTLIKLSAAPSTPEPLISTKPESPEEKLASMQLELEEKRIEHQHLQVEQRRKQLQSLHARALLDIEAGKMPKPKKEQRVKAAGMQRLEKHQEPKENTDLLSPNEVAAAVQQPEHHGLLQKDNEREQELQQQWQQQWQQLQQHLGGAPEAHTNEEVEAHTNEEVGQFTLEDLKQEKMRRTGHQTLSHAEERSLQRANEEAETMDRELDEWSAKRKYNNRQPLPPPSLFNQARQRFFNQDWGKQLGRCNTSNGSINTSNGPTQDPTSPRYTSYLEHRGTCPASPVRSSSFDVRGTGAAKDRASSLNGAISAVAGSFGGTWVRDSGTEQSHQEPIQRATSERIHSPTTLTHL